MGLGHQGEHQKKLFLFFDEIPLSRGHAFYDRLQQILWQFRFDAFVEKLYQPYYADKGRPLIPTGRYFRRHFVGAASNGVAPIPCPCESSCNARPTSPSRTIPR
jgi:transposase